MERDITKETIERKIAEKEFDRGFQDGLKGEDNPPIGYLNAFPSDEKIKQDEAYRAGRAEAHRKK